MWKVLGAVRTQYDKFELLLAKTKKNKTQHSIKAAERAKNVIGVYSPIDKNLIKGKRILIIDDIITTGSTLWRMCKNT